MSGKPLMKVCTRLILCVLGSVSLTASSPQIWFGPLDDITRRVNVFFGIIPPDAGGATDYMRLFEPGAPWPQAASRVSVFEMTISPITGIQFGSLTDAQLRQIFSFLNQRGIALAVDFGPLIAPGHCGQSLEGFNGTSAQLLVDKIRSNGGVLRYIALDEPLYFGHIYNGPGACRWSIQEVAANAQPSLNIIRAAFPDVLIGSVEPVPAFGAPDWLATYAAWMDAFQAAAGRPLAFFHADTGFASSWLTDVAALRAETSRRSIPFGVIYDGLQPDATNAAWLTHADQMAAANELENGLPDHAIFQSWHAYPTVNLPESAPFTFTSLINRYLRPRSSLSLNVSLQAASGRLVDSVGGAIGGAPVTLSADPIAGAGFVATYTLSGVVPSSITSGGIQICVNMCDSLGSNQMSVYGFRYADAVHQVTRDFTTGLGGWGANPTGTAALSTGADSDGSFLRILASPSQYTYVNSVPFPVTPGSPYSLTIRARIAPGSTGSGHFALMFNRDREVSRDTLAFSPASLTIGTIATAPDGAFSFPLNTLDLAAAGAVRLRASFAGTDAIWPASATSGGGGGGPAPAAPASLTHSVRGNIVTLNWSSSTNASLALNYTVLARLVPTGPVVAALPVGNATTLTVAAPGGVYYVTVRAESASGTSPESPQVTILVP